MAPGEGASSPQHAADHWLIYQAGGHGLSVFKKDHAQPAVKYY